MKLTFSLRKFWPLLLKNAFVASQYENLGDVRSGWRKGQSPNLSYAPSSIYVCKRCYNQNCLVLRKHTCLRFFLTPYFHLGSSRTACLCWDRPRRPLRNPGFPPIHICVRHACVTFVRAAICVACVFVSAGMHVVCIPAVVHGWREMSVTPLKSRKKQTNILAVGSCQCV